MNASDQIGSAIKNLGRAKKDIDASLAIIARDSTGRYSPIDDNEVLGILSEISDAAVELRSVARLAKECEL